MNCFGENCPIKEDCKRFTNPVKGEPYYKVNHYFANGCNFHLKDETLEEKIEARNDDLRERFKNQLS